MANLWELPTSITVNGHEYAIRTDYRAVLDILTAFSDKDMYGDDQDETRMIQAKLILDILFVDSSTISDEDIPECLQKAIDFIDMGIVKDSTKKQPKVMDWEQDSTLIIPAINKVLGREVRAEKYMHWWTFLSAYLEIGECTFSHILSIRQKKASGKKLEKWEQEYITSNKELVLLREKLTEQEKQDAEDDKKALDALLGSS